MLSDNASQEAVKLFWKRCGETESFPRSLERSIALALPLSVIKLPHLRLTDVEEWLASRNLTFQFCCRSRAVRGCIVAFGGEGLIFIDGADPPDEQRYTLAHEVAHFMADYWLPRQRARETLGPEVLDVFDGFRPPTVKERVHSVLAQTTVGIYTDLMSREEISVGGNQWESEHRADRIALALLAPRDVVLAEADTSLPSFDQRFGTVTTLLRQRFGLPPNVADSYGRLLLVSKGRGPSWVEGLRRK